MKRRVATGLAVPKGAVIIGVYLFGMSGIAAGAYSARDHIFDGPFAGTDVSDRMPLSLGEDEFALPSGFGDDDRNQSSVNAPQMARLTPSETSLRDGLFHGFSRLFTGKPHDKIPDRPNLDAVREEWLSGLRPKARPQGLVPDLPEDLSAEDLAVRLVSLDPNETLAALPEDSEESQDVPETPAVAAPSASCPRRLAKAMPKRRGGAKGAKAFLASVKEIDGVKRDRQVVSELLNGNMPRFQHNLVPVNMRGKIANGQTANITLCVTPDYLALGSDSDYVRVPLGLSGAAQVAQEFDMLLPTPRMVDAIYRQADLRLTPRPMSPGPQMTSTNYFMRHNSTIEAQRRSTGAPQGTLISGHKKDVVATSRLASNRGRVAIYGWHRRNGTPIQPLSTVHGAGYADYSHGIRLVSRTAFLNGREVDLQTLIADPRYAGLISNEGPLGRAALASN